MFYRRLRYLIRFYWAFIRKYRLAIFLTIVLAAILINLPPIIIKKIPKFRPTETIGIVGRHNITNLPQTIQKKLSIGLTVLDSSNQPQPGLAKSWDSTESGTLYSFTVDTGLKWSDGKNIKSADLSFNFKDTEISYPDNQTVNIKLTHGSYSPLPVILSKPIFRKIPFIGVGSYKISKYHQKGDSLSDLTLIPVDSQSSLPKLVYRFYSSQELAITALKLGEVRSLESIANPEDIASWNNYEIRSEPDYSRIIAVIFNTKSKYFSGSTGKIFRSTLNIATDKSQFTYKITSPISPNSWAFSTKVKAPAFDPDKASAQIKKVELIPDPLVLYSFPAYLDVAENLKKDWEKIGIHTNIVSINDFPSEYDAILMPIPIPTDPDQYTLWHSTSETYNFSNLNNPRIDKLLEDGRKETSQKKRGLIYEDFQKYLLDETPAIFLYFPSIYSISKK